MTLLYIILATFVISLVSFAGVLILFLKEQLLQKIILALVSFSAGALMAGAFFNLLPEAIAEAGQDKILNVFLFSIIGFCLFFVLENFIRWHHHHAKDCPDCQDQAVSPFSHLILISDGLHNFIDGLVIAASFVVSVPLGIATALAVFLHEIPQEIGDYGVLVYGGMKKTRALFLNFLSAMVAVAGGLVGFLLSERVGQGATIFLLSFAAGNFIYISASDLIPEIKQRTSPQKSLIHFFVFLFGITVILLLNLWTF